MPPPRRKGSDGDAADRPQDPLVDRLRPKPSEPPQRVIVLEGLLGDSDRDGYRRLYLTRALDYYAEFRAADVIDIQPIEPDQPPFMGETATRVTLPYGAPIDYTHSAPAGGPDEFDLDVRLGPSRLSALLPFTRRTDCIPCVPETRQRTDCIPCIETRLPTRCETACGTCVTCDTCATQCDTCLTCATRCDTCVTCATRCDTCVTCATRCDTCLRTQCDTCGDTCARTLCDTCGGTCVRTCDTCGIVCDPRTIDTCGIVCDPRTIDTCGIACTRVTCSPRCETAVC